MILYTIPFIISKSKLPEDGFIEWLQETGLLSTHHCRCGGVLRNEGAETRDQYILWCAECNRKQSVRTGSLFENSKIPLYEYITVLTMFDADLLRISASSLMGFNKKTVDKVYNKSHELVQWRLTEIPQWFKVFVV
jgi:hypothetical protein